MVGKGVEEAEFGGYIGATPDRVTGVCSGRADSSPGEGVHRPALEPGRPVELGVAVCVVEDQYQFILHHKLLWKEDRGGRGEIEETQALPDLRMCSFDRGFHSRNNRIRLDDRLELNALPGKGRRNRAAREREEAEEFAARDGSIRRWSRRSTRWSIAVSTGSAPTAPRASRAWLRCRCWRGTCGPAEFDGNDADDTSGGVAQPVNGAAASRRSGPVHHQSPTQTDRWHLPGCNWRGKCGGSFTS